MTQRALCIMTTAKWPVAKLKFLGSFGKSIIQCLCSERQGGTGQHLPRSRKGSKQSSCSKTWRDSLYSRGLGSHLPDEEESLTSFWGAGGSKRIQLLVATAASSPESLKASRAHPTSAFLTGSQVNGSTIRSLQIAASA
jgi:hypothetical protein